MKRFFLLLAFFSIASYAFGQTSSGVSGTPSIGSYQGIYLKPGSTPSGRFAKNGTIIYNHSLQKFQAYQNGVWGDVLIGTASGWGLAGNSISTGQFFGTTNDQDIVLKRNGVVVGIIQDSDVSVTVNGEGNLALGEGSGINLSTVTNAYNNTLVGHHAGTLITTGYQNTVLGSRSGPSLTTGFQNTFVGQGAGNGFDTQSGNVAIGFHAGVRNYASESVLIGNSAGQGSLTKTNNTGGLNVAIGVSAMGGTSLTTAQENVFVGRNSGLALTTGNNNTVLGAGSGLSLTNGANNVFIGYRSGYTDVGGNATTTGSENTFIGYQAGMGSSTQISKSSAFGYRAKVSENLSMVFGSIVDADRVNYGFGGESYGGGKGVAFFKNRVTVPTSNPTNGFLLYSNSGSPYVYPSTGAQFPLKDESKTTGTKVEHRRNIIGEHSSFTGSNDVMVLDADMADGEACTIEVTWSGKSTLANTGVGGRIVGVFTKASGTFQKVGETIVSNLNDIGGTFTPALDISGGNLNFTISTVGIFSMDLSYYATVTFRRN